MNTFCTLLLIRKYGDLVPSLSHVLADGPKIPTDKR